MPSRRLLTACLCLNLAAPALADTLATAPVTGIDAAAMDKDVRPQDDLFRFVNGKWLAETPFPAEYASAGIGIMLFEKAQSDVQAILLEDVPILVLHVDSDTKGMKRSVQGYEPTFESVLGGFQRLWLKS